MEYLTRTALYEKRINAAIAINARALEEADVRDAERAQGRVRGPLHGIPIALKDNIHTLDMPTTGGALAFAHFKPPYEATLTKDLRDAGAIIIAKTVLTELANWVAGAPTPMPGNYSAIGGFAFNPYDPRPDPRDATNDGRPVLSTGASSSGAGTAPNFWAANVGTDTAGSVVNPAHRCGNPARCAGKRGSDPYPEIVVPPGMVPVGPPAANPFPPGFDPQPAPFSAAFVGPPCGEPRLIEIAYAFEQAARRRLPPPAVP